ncbi:LysR family transcriptional regulator [Microvirga pudoricolor]|uniref:LysR family transcriptional regulator n=1 Tax=Microvirga pudoricolor TaxID=2778729 RepID=UPI00194F1288|nr:LysR family transcriptional regulator [Microvirga pudoricolor]MBM6595536.1 LysR family transcriptional regulator [Microvirga pudoricolor]
MASKPNQIAKRAEINNSPQSSIWWHRTSMNLRVSLRHLQTFLAIVEEGTLTAAANRLHKSQGAISQDLVALEASCGVKLIDRSGQRVKLTAAGDTLLPDARDIVQRVQDAEASMRRVRNGEAGTIRIGMLPSLTVRTAEYVAEFHRRHPGTRFELTRELQTVLVERLRRGELDIVVGHSVLRSDIELVVVETEPVNVVVSERHELASAGLVRASDLIDLPFISNLRDMNSTRGAESFFESIGRYPDPAFQVDDYKTMQTLIRSGVGYGIMPSCVSKEKGLVEIRTEPKLERQVAILRTRSRRSSSVGEAFSFLSQEWGQLPVLKSDLVTS